MAPIGTASDIDDLKRKCPGALADTELVNIVKIAPLNNNGKINLSWIDREAEKYLRKNLSSSQTIERLGKETRVLAKFCRDHAEDFEKLVAQEKPPEPEIKPAELKKKFTDMEFDIAPGMELITRGNRSIYNDAHTTSLKHSVRFLPLGFGFINDQCYPSEIAYRFCMEILNALVGVGDPSIYSRLEDNLIRLLEEKFGLKVKICANCVFSEYSNLVCKHPDLRGTLAEKSKYSPDYTCNGWTQKVSNKKEN